MFQMIGLIFYINYQNQKKKINTNITFVDIAGLVKGASKVKVLGNKFCHILEKLTQLFILLDVSTQQIYST